MDASNRIAYFISEGPNCSEESAALTMLSGDGLNLEDPQLITVVFKWLINFRDWSKLARSFFDRAVYQSGLDTILKLLGSREDFYALPPKAFDALKSHIQKSIDGGSFSLNDFPLNPLLFDDDEIIAEMLELLCSTNNLLFTFLKTPQSCIESGYSMFCQAVAKCKTQGILQVLSTIDSLKQRDRFVWECPVTVGKCWTTIIQQVIDRSDLDEQKANYHHLLSIMFSASQRYTLASHGHLLKYEIKWDMIQRHKAGKDSTELFYYKIPAINEVNLSRYLFC